MLNKQQIEFNEGFVGELVPVLLDRYGRRDQLAGRSRGCKQCASISSAAGAQSAYGTVLDVQIISAHPNSLAAVPVNSARTAGQEPAKSTYAVTDDDGASPVVLEFEDNQLLPLLYGDFDRHLARIEQALEVTIASRGNTVTITGEAAATEIARVCLESLYRRLVDGLEVSAGEVDAAVRLAQGAAAEGRYGVEEIASGKMIIRTPKRHPFARSPGQQNTLGLCSITT